MKEGRSDAEPQINDAMAKDDDPLRAALNELTSQAPKRVDINRKVLREVVAERRFFRQFAPVLAACWEALMEEPCEREVAEQHGLTLDWFLYHYRDSYIVPILVGKERRIAGAMWFHHGDVHLAIKREYRRTGWVRRLPEMFEVGFHAFGPKLVAKINARNRVARRFTEKLGGLKVSEDDLVVAYEMQRERMTYARMEHGAQEKRVADAGEVGSDHMAEERRGGEVLHRPDGGADAAGPDEHQGDGGAPG